MKKYIDPNAMRISFDLDEVLFVSPKTHKVEPELKFPWNLKYKERLREGTPKLIHDLQEKGYSVWVYTSSFRSISYIKGLFRHYGITFDDIINGERHRDEVQGESKVCKPSKLPSRYRISLHIDDERSVYENGRGHGFDVFPLFEQDDDWVEKIEKRADEVCRRKMLQEQLNNKHNV